MINEELSLKISQLSRFNRADNISEVMCGCFYCQKVFSGSIILEFADDGKTLICPHCGIDSVIVGEQDVDVLKKYNEVAF